MLAALPSFASAQTSDDVARAIINGLFGQPQKQASPAGRGRYDTPPGVQPKGPIDIAGCEGLEVVRYTIDDGMGRGLKIFGMLLRNRSSVEKAITVFVERADAPDFARKANITTTIAPGRLESITMSVGDRPPRAVKVVECI